MRRSKTDQVGEGTTKALPYGRAHQTCPVCAYVRWREILDAADTDGRVGVLRVLHTADPFEEHLCRSIELPDRGDGVFVFRGVHKTGAIATKALSGQAVNPLLRRRADQAGLGKDLLELLGATPSAPGSSPRPSAPAPTRPRSCAKLATPPRRVTALPCRGVVVAGVEADHGIGLQRAADDADPKTGAQRPSRNQTIVRIHATTAPPLRSSNCWFSGVFGRDFAADPLACPVFNW